MAPPTSCRWERGPVPRAKCAAKRIETLIAHQPLQEAVQEEREDDPTILVRLEGGAADHVLPRSDHESPIVAAAHELPAPIGFYLDWLPYS